MVAIVQQVTQLTEKYQPVLSQILEPRERIRSIYGTGSPLMEAHLAEDLTGFAGYSEGRSQRLIGAFGKYLGLVETIISTSPVLQPVVGSEFLHWVWDPTLGRPVTALYSHVEDAGREPNNLIDVYSFRKFPVALKYGPRNLFDFLATLSNTAIAKAMEIAWGYVPSEYDFPDINTASLELIGVAKSRWEQLTREGLGILVTAMSTRPERFTRLKNPQTSLLELTREIASAQIPRINNQIHVGTSRIQISQNKLKLGLQPEGGMGRKTQRVADFLKTATDLPSRKTLSAELGLKMHDVDNALARISGNYPSSDTFRTAEGVILKGDLRGQLIETLSSGEIKVRDLSLLTTEECLLLALLTGTNPQNFYLNTAELTGLWDQERPGFRDEFNTNYWSKTLPVRLQPGLLNTEILDQLANSKGVSEIEKKAAVFLQEFFWAGRSLRSGELYSMFINYFKRFDLPVYLTAVNLLSGVIDQSKVSGLRFLEVPEKVARAPFIPGPKQIANFAERIDSGSLPDTVFAGLLRSALAKPDLIRHLTLEERVIVGIALQHIVRTGNFPSFAEIAAGSGKLQLRAVPIELKANNIALLDRLGQLEFRYANLKIPIRDTPRCRLIHQINALPEQEKADYLATLGSDRSFILGLLTGTRYGFYFTGEEMTTLWFYRYGDLQLPTEQQMIARLAVPAPVDGTKTGMHSDTVKGRLVQQLRDRLTQKEFPVPGILDLKNGLPLEPAQVAAEDSPFSSRIKRDDTIDLLRRLSREYRIRIPLNTTFIDQELSAVLKQAGIVFIWGIPLDAETFDLLGWSLSNGAQRDSNQLQQISGYSPGMIAARSEILTALQETLALIPPEQRQTELRRIRKLFWNSKK